MKIITLTLSFILLIGYGIATVKTATFTESESSGQLLEDCGGEIEVVICSATSARRSSLRNSELVSNIVNGLPSDAHVLILVNDRDVFKTSAETRRVTFIEVPQEKNISIWPQDPFVVIRNQNQTRLVVPCMFDRENDQAMPHALGDALNIEVVKSELYFEGGNIVCGQEAVFTGVNTINTNMKLLEESSTQIKERLETAFGKPLVVVGKNHQAISHIDLVVTPLGNKRIAVADARWGAELARNAVQSNPEQVRTFEKDCEDLFFGHQDIRNLADLDGNVITRPEIIGQTGNTILASLKVADELDEIAKQLVEKGYEVLRIPALVPDLTPVFSETGMEKPSYPFLTYNNVLLEQRNGRPIVYLPQYGLPALDTMGKNCWRDLGYDVELIHGFATSSMYGGSLRCCTKVLLRGDLSEAQ